MVFGLAGCSDSTGANAVKPEDELNFLRPAPSAPPLVQTSVSFYAVRGQDRIGQLFFRPRPGHTDSSEFVKLDVDGRSLDRRPDGSPIAMGDSILITITVVDFSRLILDFQPSGLQFVASEPAELEIEYEEADDDINEDGVVDSGDAALRPILAIWRQENPGAAWTREPSSSSGSVDEVEADIQGFTRYAIAY